MEEGDEQQGAEDKQLKAACHYHIAKICEEEGRDTPKMHLTRSPAKKLDKTISKQSVACLTEIFYGFASNSLLSFALPDSHP